MADDESPRPFRRERNLSNRNFARHGGSARSRRFSTESHSSVDSLSLNTNTNASTSTSSNTSDSKTSTSSSSTTSSSFQLSYSVNSDTENAFNRKSLLKMRPASAAADGLNTDITDTSPATTPQTPDPALLGVKQKVLRFEGLQADERIIFKTGKFHSRSMQQLNENASASNLAPLRMLPVLLNRRKTPPGDDAQSSPMQSTRSSGASFHTSIDEERSEDEVDEISDFAEDELDTARSSMAGEEYELPEEAEEVKENTVPSLLPLLGYASHTAADVDGDAVSLNVPESGLDDFGKVEAVRRTNSSVHTIAQSAKNLSRSSEQDASSGSEQLSKSGSKDFVRNYRSAPRPKTEIIGTKNRHVVNKFNSFYQPNDDDAEEEEEPELRDKCAKFIHPILEELIKTEETYVENLLMGIENYGNIFTRKDLPTGLRGKKYVLLGNIEQIAEFHRDEFLPMLLRNRRDLKRLFDEFQLYIDQNCFYGYVIFTMNKQRSLKLCDVYKNYFKLIQSELDDKLGINSFLVQPIQRMARYPLLLQQFITTLFKNRDFVMKPLIESCCRLEKKVRTLLTTTNESEVINDIVDCNEFNVFYQGKFRKVSEFMVVDHTLKRSYRSKVFIFDKCIIYTEMKGKSLVFHGRYPCEHIGIVAKTKIFTLFYERRKQQECDFAGDPLLIEMWLELIRDMINSYAAEERLKLHERYSRENDHLHRKPPSLSLFRDSNRFSTDSGIGNIWVMPKPEVDESASPNRTTWYAVS